VAGRATDPRAVPVQRTEMATRDMHAIADLINRQFVEHRPRFRCAEPVQVDAGAHSVTAGLLEAAVVRYKGFDYYARVSPPDDFFGLVTLSGTGILATDREEVRFARGDVLLDPTDLPCTADMHDCAFALLRIPRSVVSDLAEEYTGLSGGDLRFESISPVSAPARASWSQTVAFTGRQLLGSGITQISPIMAQETARLAAAVLLGAFPNTAMSCAHIPDPGHVPPVTVRRAAAFADAHAGRPVTVTEIAAAAGVTPRALQYAFRRHYGTTITGYLRQIRLEHAHRELQAADPTAGAPVAQIARRWGWTSPASFAATYRKQYQAPPSHTLRT
jgi:AraC-like DNA-binding protein